MSETSLGSKVGDLVLYSHVWVFSLSFFVCLFVLFRPRPVVDLDAVLFSVYEQSLYLCPVSWRLRKVVFGVRLTLCMFVISVCSKQTKYLSPLPFLPGKRSAVELFTKGVLEKSS